MKQPKKLTRQQKIEISGAGIDPGEYMIVDVTEDGYLLMHKKTGEMIAVKREGKR